VKPDHDRFPEVAMSNRVPSLRRTRRRLVGPLLALVVVAGIGLYLFQPWRVFTSTTVDEALPTTTAAAAAPPSAGTAASSAAQPGPVDVAAGSFVSGEHTTTGTARLERLADGSAVLRLENLSTSDGPDVRIYLSTRPAAESRADTLGDGALELDKLKGNLGNQNYTIPAGTDLTRFHSAVIWCKRFSVTFGAAELTAS
jgi:hypothetical protein